MVGRNTWLIVPMLCLGIGAFAVYLVARLVTEKNQRLASLSAGIFVAALGSFVPLVTATRGALDTGGPLPVWGGVEPGSVVLRSDPGALVIIGVALALGALTSVYSGRYLAHDRRKDLYYPLLLLMVTGLCGMVLADDLFNLYLFCELMSVAAYVLVAFRRHSRRAIEAGFKYLVMGSVGTLLFLAGVALIYRAQGSITLGSMNQLPPGSPELWTRAGLACILVGLGVKSALVPLHTWLPDAHGRAPSSISAMLSGIIIQSALYAMLKASLGTGMPARTLGGVLMAVSIANMTLGNMMALAQTDTKRLLGFSTVAQTGYMLFGIAIGLHYGIPEAIQAGFFMLVAHSVMKALAFLSTGVHRFYLNTSSVDQLQGTASRMPVIALTFSVALGGLAGIPPLAGFISKWFILGQVLQPGEPLAYVGLAIFLLNTLLALGYYLPLVARLFVLPDGTTSQKEKPIAVSAWMAVPLVAAAALVIAIGLYPEPWWTWVDGVGPYLLGR